MEAVHKTALRPWISAIVNVKQFCDEWSSSLEGLGSDVFGKTSPAKEKLMETFAISQEVVDQLENECGINALDCEMEDTIELEKTFDIPEDVDLTTLRLQKQDVEKRNEDSKYRSLVYQNFRYRNYPPSVAMGHPTLQPHLSEKESCKVELPEVLLTVQIFRPEKQFSRLQKKAPSRIPVFTIDQEFCVLGCQHLTDLRDSINCVSDIAVPGDFSEIPDMPQNVRCQDLYKSGFFYVNGTFYNDMRDPDNRDYSDTIIKWSEEKDRGIGPFTSKKMENSRFIDLELQLGYPYVYVHQGYCEHLLVFSDLRMLHRDDSHNVNDYPMYQTLQPKKRVFCMVCHIHTARWITFKNSRLPEDPYFFCDNCFHIFNYDHENKKIGEFRAQPYFDRTAIL